MPEMERFPPDKDVRRRLGHLSVGTASSKRRRGPDGGDAPVVPRPTRRARRRPELSEILLVTYFAKS
jgi:hypothetical protein